MLEYRRQQTVCPLVVLKLGEMYKCPYCGVLVGEKYGYAMANVWLVELLHCVFGAGADETLVWARWKDTVNNFLKYRPHLVQYTV